MEIKMLKYANPAHPNRSESTWNVHLMAFNVVNWQYSPLEFIKKIALVKWFIASETVYHLKHNICKFRCKNPEYLSAP